MQESRRRQLVCGRNQRNPSRRCMAQCGGIGFPRAEGNDYEMQQQFRAGKTFGTVPFDELFLLGLERDNDLWMRGHIDTRDGRKGSAP
jgi:hypothetical protein